MFIKRIHKYAVKKLKSGAARIYINSNNSLKSAGLFEGMPVKITYLKNKIIVEAHKDGENKVMDTGRGALLELKNKSTASSIGEFEYVSVTFRKGKVVISISYSDKKKMEREKSLFNALENGKKIRTASFFSGIGMLSYHLKKGMEKSGIESEITFANDSSSVAMECNLSGNPIWSNASEDAFAVVDDLENLDLSELVQAHMLEVGYPCVAQSTLCEKSKRDLEHPVVGTLFIKLLAAIEKINPAIIIFENTPAFVNSKTLEFIKKEMKGYRFEESIFNAHSFGEIEARKRACVVAISNGLPEINIENLAPGKVEHNKLSDFMEEIKDDSELWRVMEHVKIKALNPNLNYKNMLYKGAEKLIATLTATYAAPKAGSPMISHPTNKDLQRQLTVKEHSLIRRLPKKMFDEIMKIESGESNIVSTRGSKTTAHRLLGNGVSKKLWNEIGAYIGEYLNSILKYEIKNQY